MYCSGIQCTDAEIKSIHFEVKQKGQLFHMTPEGFCLGFFPNCYVSAHTLLKLVCVLGKLIYHSKLKTPQTSKVFSLKIASRYFSSTPEHCYISVYFLSVNRLYENIFIFGKSCNFFSKERNCLGS